MIPQSYYSMAISMFVAFAVSSCGGKSNNADTVLTILAEKAGSVPVDSILESLHVTPLKLNADHYPHGVNSLIATDSLIVVFDNKNIVYLYDNDGEYISDSADKVGKGEGEYSVVTTISYNKFNDCIEIATPTNMLLYDKDFNLVRTGKLPTKKSKDGLDGMFFGYIHDISGHEHLLIPSGVFDDNRRIILYDSDSDKVTREIEYDGEVIADITMQTHCFQDISSDQLAFFPPGVSDYVYSLNPEKESLGRLYRIDLGRNGISRSDLGNHNADKETVKAEILNSDKAFPLKTMMYGDHVIVLYKDGKTMRNFHTLVWNVKDGDGYTLDAYSEGKLSFPVIDYSSGNGMYSIVDSETLQQLTSGINPQKIITTGDSIPEGSLVLLRYEIKDNK